MIFIAHFYVSGVANGILYATKMGRVIMMIKKMYVNMHTALTRE